MVRFCGVNVRAFYDIAWCGPLKEHPMGFSWAFYGVARKWFFVKEMAPIFDNTCILGSESGSTQKRSSHAEDHFI